MDPQRSRPQPGRPGAGRRCSGTCCRSPGSTLPRPGATCSAPIAPAARGVTVAVLDSGVAYRNWQAVSPVPGLPRHPVRAIPTTSWPTNRFPLDRNGHGTFVAGIIAEATNNGIGLAGLAYGASIMPVRILDASGLGDEVTIAEAIRYAVDHGAQVINLSLEFLPNEVSSASRHPGDRLRDQLRPRAAASPWSARPATTRPRRSPTRRGPRASSRSARRRATCCLADYSNGGTGLSLVAPGGGSDAIMPARPALPSRARPALDLPAHAHRPPHWAASATRLLHRDLDVGARGEATAALVIASGVIGRHPVPGADAYPSRADGDAARGRHA